MKRCPFCLALGITLVLGSCAITDVSHTADFSKYKTFGWGKANIQVDNPAYRSGLINANIRNAVKAEFQRRGLEFRNKNPDLLVSYQTYTEKKEPATRVYPYANPYPWFYSWWGFPYGPYMWGYPYGPHVMQSAPYTEGTLIIDITDRATDELVWRGMVRGNVDDIGSLQKHIAKGVRAIVKKYPSTGPSEPIRLPKDKNIM